jgi:hypothetical protein
MREEETRLGVIDWILVRHMWRDETGYFEVDKTPGTYIGSVVLWENELILENSISVSSFFRYSLKCIDAYLEICRFIHADSPRQFPLLEIFQLETSDTGVQVVCLKTFWLREFQRKWKREYQRRKDENDWRRKNILYVIRNTELFGNPRPSIRESVFQPGGATK